MSWGEEMDDIIMNPHKYGAPSFEEFSRNPSRYQKPEDQPFIAPDSGKAVFDKLIKTRKFFFRDGLGKTHRCKTIDAVEKIAQAEGVSNDMLEYDPQVVPTGDGRCEVHVTFYRKPLVPGLIMT